MARFLKSEGGRTLYTDSTMQHVAAVARSVHARYPHRAMNLRVCEDLLPQDHLVLPIETVLAVDAWFAPSQSGGAARLCAEKVRILKWFRRSFDVLRSERQTLHALQQDLELTNVWIFIPLFAGHPHFSEGGKTAQNATACNAYVSIRVSGLGAEADLSTSSISSLVAHRS